MPDCTTARDGWDRGQEWRPDCFRSTHSGTFSVSSSVISNFCFEPDGRIPDSIFRFGRVTESLDIVLAKLNFRKPKQRSCFERQSITTSEMSRTIALTQRCTTRRSMRAATKERYGEGFGRSFRVAESFPLNGGRGMPTRASDARPGGTAIQPAH
jgi:hypothetical protein